MEEAQEVKKLVSALEQNHYPRSVINRCNIRRNHITLEDDGRKNGLIVLPYIQGTSELEELRLILGHANIKAVFKPCATMRQQLMKPKDPVCVRSKTSVVYSIFCIAWNEGHQIDWNEMTVLTAENNLHRRLTRESRHIHQHLTTV